MAAALPGPWAWPCRARSGPAGGAELFGFETISRGAKRQTGTSEVVTVQIKVLAPPQCQFESQPGRTVSCLSGPGQLLQGRFLLTNPLALGNEGVPAWPQVAPNPSLSPPTFGPLPSNPSPIPSPSLLISSSKCSAGLNTSDSWAHALAGELTGIRGSGIPI